MFLESIIIAVKVSLERLYAHSICLSFLCVWNEIFGRNLRTIVVARYFCRYTDDSTDSLNLRSCGTIYPKTVLIFPKNFLNFRSDTIEKYGVISLSSYSRRKFWHLYFLMIPKSPFLRKKSMQRFVHFFILFIHSIA